MSDPHSAALGEAVLSNIGSKWALRIITLLGAGTYRFSQIQHELDGISQKTLSQALRALERDGFLTRTAFAVIPPRVDYELSELGRDLLILAEAGQQFAERHQAEVEASRRQFDSASPARSVIALSTTRAVRR